MKSILDWPLAYLLVQRLLRGKNFYPEYLQKYLRPAPGARILDIGCGPGPLVPYLPDHVDYYGVDYDQAYIDFAQRRYGHRGTFICGSVDGTDLQLGSFDLVVGTGILHHLDDDNALTMLKLARTYLRPGGRFVLLDGCWLPRQSFFSMLLLYLDRGSFVRTVAHYRSLIETVFENPVCHVRQDMFQVPYNVVVFECSV